MNNFSASGARMRRKIVDRHNDTSALLQTLKRTDGQRPIKRPWVIVINASSPLRGQVRPIAIKSVEAQAAHPSWQQLLEPVCKPAFTGAAASGDRDESGMYAIHAAALSRASAETDAKMFSRFET